MNTDDFKPPWRSLSPEHRLQRKQHLLAEIAAPSPRPRRRLVLALALALIVIAGATIGTIKATTANGGQPGPLVPSSLANSSVSTAGYAGNAVWAITANGLELSTPRNGWQNITPPGVPASGIRSAYFADSTSGWLAAYGATQRDGSSALRVYRTTDAGGSWQMAGVNTSSLYTPSAPAWLSFVNKSDGWVETQTVSSSNFSNADLFHTTDGGATWTSAHIPIAGPIGFVTAADGFVSGGATGGDLYATHDGGASWQAVKLPGTPTGRVYGPVFTSPTDGILSVTTPSVNGSAVNVYKTTDGGLTWETPTVATTVDTSSNATTPVARSGTGWLAATGSGNAFVRTNNSTESGTTFAASGIPSGQLGQVVALDFPTSGTAGLATFAGNVCEGNKNSCLAFGAVYSTVDGGSTWSQLTP